MPIALDGMVIQPGDLVIGDADGLLCVPHDDVEQVLAACREKVALEQKNSELEQSQQFIFSLLTAMSDVLAVQDQAKIPELNEYQCGTYSMHSLEEAHAIARHVLERGIGVNHNDELALPEEKLKSL